MRKCAWLPIALLVLASLLFLKPGVSLATATPVPIQIWSSEHANGPTILLHLAGLTPTATPTAVPTATPVVGPTATPAAPASQVWLQETCPWPTTDYTIDGVVNQRDRYVALFNSSAESVDLSGYTISFGSINYEVPSGAFILSARMKYVFQADLEKKGAFVPDFGRVVVVLKNASAVVIDTYEYAYSERGKCWRRAYGGGGWYSTPVASSLN